MFGRFSLLTCIAAVALIVAAVPAPVAGQLGGYAVVGYGFRSQKGYYPATSGPMIRVSALLRVAGPVALGGEVGHYWLGETREFDVVKRDRILTLAFCMEFGKPRPGISPRITFGVTGNLVSTMIKTDTYTSTLSGYLMGPHIGLAIVRKPASATLALRAEVRTALMLGLSGESFSQNWLTSVSLGVAF